MGKPFDIFTGGPKTQFNACVGLNGWPDICDYEDGYFVAAKKIIQQTITESPKIPVDIAIYPIVFCIRHAIELSLKAQLNKFVELKRFRPAVNVPPDTLTGHDLRNLWSAFKVNTVAFDPRYSAGVEQIDWIVQQFAEIDPNGQIFRYPYGREDRKQHLIGHSVLNIERIQTAMSLLREGLLDLRHLTLDMENEFALGTYTRNLSRIDLEGISKRLPNRSEWGSASFGETRNQIKRQYNLSSNELSKALDIIQNHRRFCVNIGCETPLLGIEAGELKLMLESWRKLTALKQRTSSTENGFGTDVVSAEEMISSLNELLSEKGQKKRKIIFGRCIDNVTDESVKTIHAVFYLGRDNGSCEQFNLFLNDAIGKKDILLSHLFEKTNFESDVVKGLRKLGQTSLLREILPPSRVKQPNPP